MADGNFEQREEIGRRTKALLSAVEEFLDDQLAMVASIQELHDQRVQQLARMYNYYKGEIRYIDGRSDYDPLK